MSEKSEIKRMGATPVKNSGRGMFKGDCIKSAFLVDIKEYAESFSVSRKNWAKLSSDAWSNGHREPAFNLVLGQEGEKIRLWVIDEDWFNWLVNAYERELGNG